MSKNTERVSTLERIIAASVEASPHSRDIIEAFRPVLIRKAILVDELNARDDTAVIAEGSRLADGVPLVLPEDLVPGRQTLNSIALSLVPSTIEGFPSLAGDLETCREQMRSGDLDLSECLVCNPEDGMDIVAAWSRQKGVSARALEFLARLTLRVFLKNQAERLAHLIDDAKWNRGYCPICGSAPLIASIRQDQGTRRLHCLDCGHSWTFSRVICPDCGNEDQSSMTYFYIQDSENQTAFVCEKCRRYLLTQGKVSDLTLFDAEVCSMGLAHLDAVLQRKGFSPMVSCEWNVFPASDATEG
ncbi:MAG: formate dehydrogenase accessory protein FdhE [Desulfomonilia bacterium]|jgi:FdhE protein